MCRHRQRPRLRCSRRCRCCLRSSLPAHNTLHPMRWSLPTRALRPATVVTHGAAMVASEPAGGVDAGGAPQLRAGCVDTERHCLRSWHPAHICQFSDRLQKSCAGVPAKHMPCANALCRRSAHRTPRRISHHWCCLVPGRLQAHTETHTVCGETVSYHAQAQAQPCGRYDSPGMPTPYRAMMRHLLGGDYHSPGASEAWSPVRQSPAAAGRPCDTASEGSPATPAARVAEQEQQQQDSPGDGEEAPCPGSVIVVDNVLYSHQSTEVPAASVALPAGGFAEDEPCSVARSELAPPGNAAGMFSTDACPAEQPSARDETSTASEPLPPQQTAEAAAESMPQPLTAIPARLQSRAASATPSAADSPGAWALTKSPGSEAGYSHRR